jgi:hypothetical protein
MGIYAQAETAEKRLGQSQIASLIMTQDGTKGHMASA